MKNKVILGKHGKIDQNTFLGYPASRKIKRKTLVIGDYATIRTGTAIYENTIIGNHFTSGHNVVIREENSIGDDFSIWNGSTIDYGCKIGSNVKIHCNCYVAQFSVLEDDVFLAPGVTIANDIHPGCGHFRECMRGPHIKKGVKIGVNVTILPFITIGENSLIGSGAVVTKDVPPNSVVYGNPAKIHNSVYKLKCVSGITDKPYKEKK
jgi:acetyltransferase-like isoleucine patch superfamily enzyme